MLMGRRCVYQSTCSDHAARPPPPCTRPLMTSPLLLRIAASDFRAQISHTNCYFNFQTEIVATSRRSKEPRETEQQETPQLHHLEELFVFVILDTVNLHAVQNEGAGQQQTGATRLSHDSARDQALCAVMQHILAPMHLHT